MHPEDHGDGTFHSDAYEHPCRTKDETNCSLYLKAGSTWSVPRHKMTRYSATENHGKQTKRQICQNYDIKKVRAMPKELSD